MNKEQENKENTSPQPKEIDLLVLALKIWINRKFFLKTCIIGFIIGLIVAFSIPKEYETKVTLAPEASNKGGISGSMGTLAAMAGINIGGVANGEDAIYPELYPKIISSTPFLIDLFNIRVVNEKGDVDVTFYEYMEKYQKSPWWNIIFSAPFKLLKWGGGLFKKNENKVDEDKILDSFNLTPQQTAIAEGINSCIIPTVDKKTGVVTLAVRMQDPLISASIADSVKNKLQEYIIEYRTNKVRNDLKFAEKLYSEAKQVYVQTQQTYANYIDSNLNVVLARYKSEAERLQNEANLAFGVYNQVAQQLQLSRVKVQEVTPVYTVIQPAKIPISPIKPKKAIIIIGFVFFFFLISITWILLKDDIIDLKFKMKNNFSQF